MKAIEKNKPETVIPWFPYRLAGIAQAVVPGIVARSSGCRTTGGQGVEAASVSGCSRTATPTYRSPPRFRATYQPISTS